MRGGGWLGRSARRGGGGRECQTAARSRVFAVPRRARPSSNPDVLAARLAKALAFRMDGVRGRRTSGERVVWSRRRALGFDRAAHARVRVSFGSVPAHRGGDGEASPGAWFRCERRASRVVRKHTGEGATVADVPRPPVVFAVRVIEDYELCSASSRSGVSRRHEFFLDRNSRATSSVVLESRSVKRESGRGR